MFKPQSDWRPPDLNSLPSWDAAKRVGLDTETRDPMIGRDMGIGVRHGGYITGISFAIEDGPKHYLPIRHEGGDNLSSEAVFAYLRDQVKCFRGEIVGANLGYDLDYLAQEGIDFLTSPILKAFRDVQVAEPLIDEQQFSFSLENIAQRYGFEGKKEGMLQRAAAAYKVNPKDGMWRLPARYVGEYGEEDADLPLKILRKQERVIDEQDLWQIYNLESAVLPVLTKMRRRGVRVDLPYLEHVERWALAEETEALAKVKAATGIDVGVGNVWKAEAMAAPLRHIGVVLTADAKGKPSVDAELLASLKHPVADALARARKVNKLRTTFAKSVRAYMVNGRIHCTFNQLKRTKDDGETLGAISGRLSCGDPNLQQQPARDPELGPFWRKVYLPDEGMLWCTADYSQQEPRWCVHFAAAAGLKGAAEAVERYHRDPKTDSHDMMTLMVHGDDYRERVDKKVWKTNRDYCKQIYLGLTYGMGGAKLARKLGLPTAMSQGRVDKRVYEVAGPEAQAIMDRVDSRVPYLRKLAKLAARRAEQKGYIVTVLGRRLRFPRDEAGNVDWAHKALNKVIQGSSADQAKQAMVNADKAGHPLQLQVHDELDESVRDRKMAEELAQIMRDCVPCLVPHRIDIELGPSWGETA